MSSHECVQASGSAVAALRAALSSFLSSCLTSQVLASQVCTIIQLICLWKLYWASLVPGSPPVWCCSFLNLLQLLGLVSVILCKLHLLLGRGQLCSVLVGLWRAFCVSLNPENQCGEFKTTFIAANPTGVTLVSNPHGTWLTDAPALCVVSHISALCLWCGFLCGSHWIATLWKQCFCCVLQVGSAQDGRARGAPPMSPPHPPTVGAAVAPKWFHSLNVSSAFYCLCHLSFLQWSIPQLNRLQCLYWHQWLWETLK